MFCSPKMRQVSAHLATWDLYIILVFLSFIPLINCYPFLISIFDLRSILRIARGEKNLVKWHTSESSIAAPNLRSTKKVWTRWEEWSLGDAWELITVCHTQSHCFDMLPLADCRIISGLVPGGRNCKCWLRSRRQLSWSEPKRKEVCGRGIISSQYWMLMGIRARMAMTGKLVNVARRPQQPWRCWVELWTEGSCLGSSHAC